MEVDSEPGKFTEFTMPLTRSRERATGTEDLHSLIELAVDGECVYIIHTDDEHPNLENARC